MWRNYLTVGFRALAKNKTYAFINIVGLAIGLAACLLILLYVRHETTYDRATPNAENAYQLQLHFVGGDGGGPPKMQMNSYVAGPMLRKDFPQVEQTVYVLGGAPVMLKDGEAISVEDAKVVDGNLFDIMQLPFVAGDRATALDRPGSIVLTETEARKQYGRTDVVGRTVTLVIRGEPTPFTIRGVVADLPRRSHLKLSMIVRVDMTNFTADQPDFLTEWGWQSGWVYAALKPGADPDQINNQLAAWEKRNIPDQNSETGRFNFGDSADFKLVNIRDIHLGEAQFAGMKDGNDAGTIATFSIIALLILGIACVNFVNLATARASQRAREVALRKVLGANRRHLIAQFVGESIAITAVAMLFALAMLELATPAFAAFLDADLAVTYFGADGLLAPALFLVLAVGLAGGLYPAFVLSNFRPATVLKANKSASDAQGSGRLRGILVVGQFAISIGLMICTAIIYLQTAYARSADPGYNRDGILQIEGLSSSKLRPVPEALIQEIANVDGVTAVGRTNIGVSTGQTSSTQVQPRPNASQVSLGTYAIGADYFDAMGIKVIAGRQFDANRPADDATLPFPEQPDAVRTLVARGVNVVLNELAVRRLGFASARDAVGKTFRTGAYADSDEYGVTTATIIGVVADSRFRSVHIPIEPIMFHVNRSNVNWLIVRYADADPNAVRANVERVWKRQLPDVPFDAEFSEDIIGEIYEAEDARAQTFAGFALLAIIVACLGLFGLAAFTAERRTKEIGIRKVLGARSRDIVRLLAWQFSKPVIIANLIAWPVAWWVMRDWLNTFDARIALTPTPFVLAGIIALAIAIGTIAGHAVKVARANPIHALRYE